MDAAAPTPPYYINISIPPSSSSYDLCPLHIFLTLLDRSCCRYQTLRSISTFDHQHHLIMSGYTDEALEEGHDLIAHAEEEAHVGFPLSKSSRSFSHDRASRETELLC